MTKTTPFLALAAAGLLTAFHPGRDAAVHLRLLRSEPKADTTLATAPAAIRLWFSQAPEVATTTIRVTGPADSALTLGELRLEQAAGTPVAADIQGSLANGRYQVRWRTMSRDGHPVTGQFAFTVAVSAPTQ